MPGKPGRKLNREPKHTLLSTKKWVKTREERIRERKAEEEARLAVIFARCEAERSKYKRHQRSVEFSKKLNGMDGAVRKAFIVDTVRGLFRNGWSLHVVQDGKRRSAQRMPKNFQPISLQVNGDGTRYNGMCYIGESEKLSLFMLHPPRTTDDQN